MERKNAWSQYSAEELSRLEAVNEDYKACLDAGKTERECVKLAVEMAKEAGYQDIKDVLKEGKSLKAGDKVQLVGLVHLKSAREQQEKEETHRQEKL